jgi:hypothetical protein
MKPPGGRQLLLGLVCVRMRVPIITNTLRNPAGAVAPEDVIAGFFGYRGSHIDFGFWILDFGLTTDG